MPTNAAFYIGISSGLAMISGGATIAKTTNRVVGVTFTDEYTVAKLKDGISATSGMTPVDRTRKATFDIVPYDAGGNPVTARTNIKIPDPCSVITISDTNIPYIDGYWNVVGSPSFTLATDGALKISIPCEQQYVPETGSYGALT